MTLSSKCKQGDPCYPRALGQPPQLPLPSRQVLFRSNTHTNVRQGTEHTHASLVNMGLSPSHSSQQALWLSASGNTSKGSSRVVTLGSLGRPQPDKS